MKVLISHGANMIKDSYGITPLLAAAEVGCTDIVEYLIKRKETSRAEQIESLELLGAFLVDKKNDLIGAIHYWKRAIGERSQEPRMPKKKSTNLVAAYDEAVEMETVEQLDELLNDPEAMQMQALLVRERVLGSAHPDTFHYIQYRGAVYADQGRFDRCISLWMYVLNQQLQHLDVLSSQTQSSLLSFAEMFAFMTGVSPNKGENCVKFDDIYSVFLKAIEELDRGLPIINQPDPKDDDKTKYSRVLIIVMHLMSLICRLKPCFSDNEILKFEKKVGDFLKSNPQSLKRQAPLHLAVDPDTTKVGEYPVSKFPCLKTVELLIELGSPVDTLDSNGNTAFEIVSQSKPVNVEILQALRKGGSHQTSNRWNIQNNKCNITDQNIYLHLP